MSDRKQFTWRIEAVTPTESSGRPWNKNINLQVIAPTLESAAAAVRERYPEATFVKVMRDRFIEDVIVVDGGEVSDGD